MDIGQIFINLKSTATNQDLISRIILLLTACLYAGFSAVMTKEIVILNNLANQTNFSAIFKFIAYLNLICSLAIILTIIFIT